MAFEVNFDGLVGPTHNYAGLSVGNLASQRHARSVSHPKQAALQGLAKMKYLADLGLKQAVLPPQRRPDLDVLRRLGFVGSDADVLARAWKEDPRLLAAAYSASSMWAANAATVTPSPDAADGRVHFTPANLVSQFHRSLETRATAAVLQGIFADESAFAHHVPLPGAAAFGDEGAANHTRLCAAYDKPAVEMFVYGRSASGPGAAPTLFPARQTLEASRAIARLHQLDPGRVVFAQQHPAAIDAGAFHNDVVAVGNQNVLLYHESAYANGREVLDELRRKFAACCGGPLHLLEVREEQVSLKDAIATYLFNSQLVTLPGDGRMALIAPLESREHAGVKRWIESVIGDGSSPITSAHFLDVRQSMHNGGGPACLRLRVVLSERELSLVHPGVMLTDELHARLVAWVERHYRDELRPQDLPDPTLARESDHALDDLSGILKLPQRIG